MEELYLVTGAAGFLGINIVERLIKLDKKIRVFILPGQDLSIFKNDLVEVFYGDLRDIKTLEPFFEGTEKYKTIVIHSAALISMEMGYNKLVYDVNVLGTKNIVKLCEKYETERLIYVSSVQAIPDKPLGQIITEINNFDPERTVGVYGRTKSMATQIVLNAKVFSCAVHPTGIMGRGNVASNGTIKMIKDYIEGKTKSTIEGGTNFVDVRDVVNGILACVDKAKDKETYILSGNYYTIKEIMDIIADVTDKPRVKKVMSLKTLSVIAKSMEFLAKIFKFTPKVSSYYVYLMRCNSNYSHEKATKELDFNPHPIKEAYEDTYNMMKKKDII